MNQHEDPSASVYRHSNGVRTVSWSGQGAIRVYQRKVLRLIRDAFDSLAPADRLLEVGCGNGKYTVRVAPLFEHTTAIDFAEGPLAIAERRPDITYVCADFFNMDLAPLGTFDGIMAILFFELVPEPDQGLKRIASLLREGGRALMIIPNPDSVHGWFLRRQSIRPNTIFWNGVSARSLEAQAARYDLHSLERGDFVKYPPEIRIGPLRAWNIVSQPLAWVAEGLPVPGSYQYLILEKGRN